MSERFLLGRDRVVQAGAGTGKTHALLTQYLHLCAGLSAREAALEPRALCALTFTDKAAGEMRERLQRRVSAIVRALAATTSDSELPEALLQIGEEALVHTAAALGRPLPGLGLWEKVLAQLPGAPIGTFHSFAASLLRRYAGLAGLDPDFTLLDEDSARALLVETSERVVLGALEGRLADRDGERAQLGAVTAEEAALVVSEYGFSGGPSAEGGTVEALCRLHRLRAEEGKDAAGLADSYRLPTLTAELGTVRAGLHQGLRALARLTEQLGPSSAERVSELDGLGAELLYRLQQLEAGALGAAVLLSEQLLLGIKGLRAKKDAPDAKEELAQTRERLKTAVEEIGALHASLRAAPLALALERLLMPLSAAYAEAKRAASALDFTDLLRQARDLLRDHATVRAEAQARFAVLLVDEFQDTNPLQAELLELLAGPLGSADAGAAPREPGRLYIVGDRKQSIYEFRGADVAAYAELCDQLLALGADKETLSRSYRSRPAVLHLVSRLFADVMRGETPPSTEPASASLGSGQPASPSTGPVSAGLGSVPNTPPFFVRWDAERDPLQAVRPADPALRGPAVELARSPALPEPSAEAAAAAAGPAEADARPAIDQEAELLAQRILALRDEGHRLGEQVVLLRRFTHLARYTLALKRAGIAHYVVRGRGFYQAQEVLDVAALLTLLSDPDDRLALLALLRSPLCGLSDDSLLRLHQQGRLALGALLHGRRGPGSPSAPGPAADPTLLPERRDPSSLSAPDPAADPGPGPRWEPDAHPDSLEDELGPPLELLEGERATAPPVGLLPADEAARLERLLSLMQVLLRLGDRLGPSACLQLIYDHTDLLAVLAADPDGEQRVANLLRLQERARSFDRSAGLRAFVRTLRLATDPELKEALASPGDEPAAQIAGEADDVVRIMTVHQAKGLEFPVVLVAGCTTRERADSPSVAYDRAVGLGLVIYEDGERVRTLAALRVDANARLRASAESARLFYVAATRARERLIFFGEAGPRPRLAGTWRAHLDALLAAQAADLDSAAADPALSPLLAEWRPGPPPPPPPPPAPVSSEALLGAARHAAALLYNEGPEAVAPPLADPATVPRLPTATAGDLLVCARRFHLRTTARLFPRGPAARPAFSEEAAGEPAHGQLRSGSLAGQLLAKADPARGGQDLEGLLLIAGLDPTMAQALELRTHLQRFLVGLTRRSSRLGTLLAPGPATTVQRAVPYALTAAAGAARLHGVLDLVHVERTAAGCLVTVIDYHYCSAPQAEGPLHAQRRALLALVAARLYPDATQLHTGLCFLREADAEPVLHRMDPAELPATDAALGRVVRLTHLTLQAALGLPVLSPRTCATLGCEYQAVCHARPPERPTSPQGCG